MNLVRWANWESFGKLVDLFDLGELVGQMSPNLVISPDQWIVLCLKIKRSLSDKVAYLAALDS